MENQLLFTKIDHTLLRPTATLAQIRTAAKEAETFHAASLCIPPNYISRVHSEFPRLTLCTVVGFPLGYSTTGAKVFETRQALEAGATEIDMVIDQTAVKNQELHRVLADIIAVRQATEGHILKVIVETANLSEEEKIQLCQVVENSGADFIKTSTGMAAAGATVEDVALFRAHLASSVQIKAAGGVNSKAQMEALLAAGASRIGCSKSVEILFPAAKPIAMA